MFNMEKCYRNKLIIIVPHVNRLNHSSLLLFFSVLDSDLFYPCGFNDTQT